MRIAITGGTGFVGGHLASALVASGHDAVAIGRDARGRSGRAAGSIVPVAADITDREALAAAFDGSEAVAHCAGINRELGMQTYARVHVEGTRVVVDAARRAGVERIIMLSFLRARPDGPTAYHRSKWAAEELVRGSGLVWTVLKAGVIHGRGDHMLDHLSHALHTFPLFPLVGMSNRALSPVAVGDVVRLLEAACTGDPRLARRTVRVLGPEQLTLGEAVRRVARVTGRDPVILRAPVAAHLAGAWVAERVMRVPLVSVAQVHILAEGVTEALPFAEEPPADLAPRTPFSAAVIAGGLPPAGRFSRADLRWPFAR